MGLRDLEKAIERGVDSALGRVFRSEVNRLEINKRVERELHAGTRKGERAGETVQIMPNDIEVQLNPADADNLDTNTAELQKQLVAMVREHARDANAAFEGPLVVRVTEAEDAQKGTIAVFATARHSVAGVPPGTLIYPSGFRLDLSAYGEVGITLGRDPLCDVEIDDGNASRKHARIRPTERGWLVEDLESTNGTRVNAFRISVQLLGDGDQVTIGGTEFLFDAS
jgi:predicted component of type VI protein secretion system